MMPELNLWRARRVSTEILALLVSLVLTLAYNGAFWAALTAERDWTSPLTWYLVIFTALAVTGLQWLLLLLLLNRWTVKPVLILLALLSAPAVYFMTHYGIPLNKTTMHNLLGTDVREVGEFLDFKFLLYILGYGILPALVIWRLDIARPDAKQAILGRAGAMLAALLMVGIGLWPVMNHLVPALRAQKELRFLITPSNYLISMGQVLASQWRAGDQPLLTIAEDAYRERDAATKPIVFVLVVGETVRAQNWGLNGYARQTTPRLANLDVINFPNVSSCGTDTVTSLPCIFSSQGRRHYDEGLIRASESLLHLVSRVGVAVHWRENQAGCKGVCKDFEVEDLSRATDPTLCKGDRCFDAILLRSLKEKIASTSGDLLIVLHTLGNHGPAYYQRYPDEFRQFTPTCDTTDLASCSREALINTYDNAILYTDHVLATLIEELKTVTTHDTGMLYVSDHGESLGENNLYLHGIPYVIAPSEQTRVPMVLWLSPELLARQRWDASCIDSLAQTTAITQDYLFNTLLDLFEVHTRLYEPALDVLAGCSSSVARASKAGDQAPDHQG